MQISKRLYGLAPEDNSQEESFYMRFCWINLIWFHGMEFGIFVYKYICKVQQSSIIHNINSQLFFDKQIMEYLLEVPESFYIGIKLITAIVSQKVGVFFEKSKYAKTNYRAHIFGGS